MIVQLKAVGHHFAKQSANWVDEADALKIIWVSFVSFFVYREE